MRRATHRISYGAGCILGYLVLFEGRPWFYAVFALVLILVSVAAQED